MEPDIDVVYQRERPVMLRIARAMLRDGTDAEDAVQEVFSKLLALPRHSLEVSRAYLVAAIKNQCLKAAQNRSRLWTVDPAGFDAYPSSMEVFSGSPGRGELIARLTRLLSPREAAVVEMRAAGMTTIDIAKELGISCATVRSHLRHARATLKRERERWEDGEP